MFKFELCITRTCGWSPWTIGKLSSQYRLTNDWTFEYYRVKLIIKKGCGIYDDIVCRKFVSYTDDFNLYCLKVLLELLRFTEFVYFRRNNNYYRINNKNILKASLKKIFSTDDIVVYAADLLHNYIYWIIDACLFSYIFSKNPEFFYKMFWIFMIFTLHNLHGIILLINLYWRIYYCL